MRELTVEQQEWLCRAQTIGFIGPKPIESVYRHALGFAQVVDILLREGLVPPSFVCVDLGSGAGIPGLFLAAWYEEARFLLVDSMRKRCDFLRRNVEEMGLSPRVEIFEGRSEQGAWEASKRRAFDVVTARGFAVPSATAENASGFLKNGGILVVSEPPDSDLSRWSVDGLRKLGFSPPNLVQYGSSFAWMKKNYAPKGEYPRGVGIPEKSPLF